MNSSERISWGSVERMAITLAKEVLEDRLVPDFVAGISRGGCIPAILVSLRMPKWVPICYINVARVPNDPEKRVFESSSFPANIDLRGKRVLLCEDTIETGRSLIVAKKWLEERGAEVRTLSFFSRMNSEIAPDFVRLIGGDDFKPSLPWERFRER